jgi:hypothetical protein
MANLFRSIVVWLMLLALPVQGFASVTMMACADGTSVSVNVGAAAVHAGAAHHDHAAMMAKAASRGGDHQPGHSALKCGGAACCTGAALAPCLPAVLPALPLATAPVSLYSGFLPAVDLAHPERPPQGQRA